MSKRWLTYSIRTAVVLMVLCAAGYGYLAAQREPYRRQQAAIQLLESGGANVTVESVPREWWTLAVPREILVKATTVHATGSDFSDDTAVGLRDLMGLRSVMLSSPLVTDAGIAHLDGKKLSDLQLGGCRITDQSSTMIGQMPALTTLILADTDITSAGVREFESLQQLEVLYLDRTCIDDQAIQIVSRLPKLKKLYVSRNRVTDDGIKTLADHPCLEQLRIDFTYVTSESAPTLLRLPNLERVMAFQTSLTQGVLDQVRREHPNRALLTAIGSKNPVDNHFLQYELRDCQGLEPQAKRYGIATP